MRNLKSINELFGLGKKINTFIKKIHPPRPDNNIAEALIKILKSNDPYITVQYDVTEEKTKIATFRTYVSEWTFELLELPIYFKYYRSHVSNGELPRRSFDYYLWIEGVNIDADDKILSKLEDLLRTKESVNGNVELIKDTSLRDEEDKHVIKKDILQILTSSN
jgi:hypothetical protein